MIEEIRANYSAAMAKAENELDTWRCPRCGSEAKWSGSVHIEWGNPECHPCNVGGVRIAMELIAIDPADAETVMQEKVSDEVVRQILATSDADVLAGKWPPLVASLTEPD